MSLVAADDFPGPELRHRAILYIGSESYDAATITVIQGLHRLGVTVYTIGKPNINSWFCNAVVDSVEGLKFDFVLSNLHWGTRWSLYDLAELRGIPRVLIDGDDTLPDETWRDHYRRYVSVYPPPPDGHEDLLIQPYRWVEPLGRYEPDVVFASQKQRSDTQAHYLPFGVHEEYLGLGDGRPVSERALDLAYVAGPGVDRDRMTRVLRAASTLRLVSRRSFLGEVRGEETVPEPIAELARIDNGVHGYYRWQHSRRYFDVLASAKVVVYAPPSATSWDSKRPWEAYACGAFVVMLRPEIDMDGYSLADLCPDAICSTHVSLLAAVRRLLRDEDRLEELRARYRDRVLERFTPVPIARYFLDRVTDVL